MLNFVYVPNLLHFEYSYYINLWQNLSFKIMQRMA